MKALYVNHYLSDTDVANYARQSFAKLAESFTKEQNDNLIRFLARGMSSPDWKDMITKMRDVGDIQDTHDLAVHLRSIPEHWVPFSHPHITLRMQAPVPIRVQCFKHKVGFSESEESRRYIKTLPEYYVPEFRLAAANVKQGSAGQHPFNDSLKRAYCDHLDSSLEMYNTLLEQGVCPEQARFVLPQGCEVNWVWTGSLYAYANFFNQRSDPHAQREIQELAHAVAEIIEPLYPVSWAALTQGHY